LDSGGFGYFIVTNNRHAIFLFLIPFYDRKEWNLDIDKKWFGLFYGQAFLLLLD